MKLLAFILLVACIVDVIQTFWTIEVYRVKHDIPLFHLKYLLCFKGTRYQMVMNIIAAIFFVNYLMD